MPKMGSPLGPGIGICPIWVLVFLHATPPLGIIVRNPMEKSEIRITTKKRLLRRFSVPVAMTGSVNIHQVLSKDIVEGNPIVLDRGVKTEDDRGRELEPRGS